MISLSDLPLKGNIIYLKSLLDGLIIINRKIQ